MKWLFSIVLLVCCPLHIQANYTTTRNYDFVKDGIYYRVLSPTTVAVTPKKYEYVTYTPSDEPNYIGKYVFESGHSGAVIIPETVSYNSNTYTVTAIDEYAFITGMNGVEVDDPIYSSEVTSVTVPGTIKTVDDTFYHCSQLRWVVLKEGIERLEGYMFYECPLLEEIYIPSTVTYIGTPFVGNCPTLSRIHVEWTTPFSLPNGAFIDQDITKVSLYVPYGCKAAYAIANYWKNFKEIIEMDSDDPEPVVDPDTDISSMNNVIYIEPMEEKTGSQATISLKMKNSAAIRGFQFDLYLPEGVTVVKSSKGKIQGSLSAGRLPDEDEHTLTFSEQADGAIRFLCSSQYDETFTGNDGEIATLKVNIADNMEDGEYPIQLKNMKLTETNISNFYETALVQTKLTISSYVVGDINGDDVVDVSDYTGVANHIHGNTPDGFNAKAADVDENGVIDVSDYTGIANIIHTGSIYGNNNASARMLSPRKANTDLNTYDNVMYISPFTASAGTQTTLSIKMKNTAEIRGFQFDLYLPEGMTVVKSNKGRIQGALSAGRLPDEDEHELTFSEQADGAIRFLCSSQYDETFTGNDGEIATLQVDIANSMADGDYPILLKDMKLTETDISKYYTADLIETTVTIGEVDTRTILDETSTTVPEAANNVDVRVLRTIKADEWSTICLPFAMSTAQVKEAFGDDVKIANFTGYEATTDGDDNVTGIKVNFAEVDAIEANHPYVIKVSSAISEFTVDNVDIDPEDEPKVATVVRTKKRWSEMIGTYVANTTIENQMLFLNGNKFWYSNGSTKMKGYRAYFDFYDVLSEVENASAKITFFDGTTEITNVNLRDNVNEDAPRYNLAGQKVSKSYKGIVIQNGVKRVIK